MTEPQQARIIRLRPERDPAPAETIQQPIQRRPVIPPGLARAQLPSTIGHAADLAWHHARYHAFRAPVYAVLYLWHAICGVLVLVRRLVRWWHVPHLETLVSLAVAAGRTGHHDALGAHGEGRRTRTRRGQILLASAAVAVATAAVAVAWLPWPAWLVIGPAAVVILARHGRPAGQHIISPAVVAPRYQTPTPALITKALGAHGISGISDALRPGGPGITYVADVHRDGDGWTTELDLPHGVTAGMILQRRAQLASGLRRPLSATWPEPVPHEHEARLRLWIGYHDISKLRPATWPLNRTGTADVFQSFPFGTDPRQRVVAAPLFEHNWLIGAMPGQGKTSAVRVVASAVALDPVCELWVHEHAGKGDLEPFARVAHRYVSGLDDDAIGYAADSLHMLRGELDTRSRRFRALPKDQRPDGKITRDMARVRSARLYPLVCIIDECQNVFMHPACGDQAKDDAAYVIRLGRAYGIILVLATQRPDKDSLPLSISGNVSVRFCLKVPGQVENDMILGTSSYKNGYNAAGFRPGTDAGLGWLRAEADPLIVRAYYLDLPACERIADRARAARLAAGTLTDPGADPRSFAADVLTVFGDAAKLRTATIASRLATLIPDVYADITPAAVASQLRSVGVAVRNVREPGAQPGQGCYRADVEGAAP